MTLALAAQLPTVLAARGGTVAAHLQGGTVARLNTTTTYVAAPLDGVNTWVNQWGPSLQICVIVVGIKLGARSAVSSAGGSGMRETMGSVFGLLLAGLLIGGALILGPIFIGVGQATG
jgi:hypothetical protein